MNDNTDNFGIKTILVVLNLHELFEVATRATRLFYEQKTGVNGKETTTYKAFKETLGCLLLSYATSS